VYSIVHIGFVTYKNVDSMCYIPSSHKIVLLLYECGKIHRKKKWKLLFFINNSKVRISRFLVLISKLIFEKEIFILSIKTILRFLHNLSNIYVRGWCCSKVIEF